MSIIASELKWYKSETVTDTTANGGKMSTVEVVDGVKNNILPDVSQAERLSGFSLLTYNARFRKIFAKLENAIAYPTTLEVLVNPVFHMKTFTPGEDWVEIFEGTQTDTQNDITDTEERYGAGALTSDITAGATTFDMTLEDATQVIYTATGNSVYIGNGINQEYHHDVDASKTGSVVTFTLDTGDMVANNYTATTPTLVATVIYGSPASLTPTFETITTDSAAGTYDDTTHPPVGNNIATVEDTYTIEFTSTTAFTVTNTNSDDLGTGNITTDLQPTNSVESLPYFTLKWEGWSGPFVALETFTLTTHPASKGIWVRQSVPAGSNSFSGDNFYIRFGGESA